MKISMYVAYALVWLSVALAVSVGLFVTKNFNCLWFLILPALVRFHTKTDKDDEE